MQVLRGEDSGEELADEEDDEDFVLDWDELMGTAGRAGDGAGAPAAWNDGICQSCHDAS